MAELGAPDDFDFWLGEWVVRDPANGAVGTNHISRILGGPVIEERFRLPGPGDTAFEGRSHSVHVPSRGWCQTWVDSEGSYLDFTGGRADGVMSLARSAVELGPNIVQRMRWREVTRDSMVWDWERSDDGGASFTLSWQLRYERATA